MSHLIYLLIMMLLAFSVPLSTAENASGALIVLGAIGIWRYSWAAINFSRALYFAKIAFPRRRARVEAAYGALPYRSHAFFLTTTFRIEPEISLRVYRSIFEAAALSEGGATVVASVVDASDVRLIKGVFAAMTRDMSRVQLIFDRIDGTGKRDALATSLATIAKQCPTRRDIVIFVDGDSCVPVDIVARSAPFFTNPQYGAVTTDERSEAVGSRMFRDWFDLRFAQRQMMMCSMGVSERVLTLTGRMSVFRADLATNRAFIEAVRKDHIDHWRLGRIDFLTGDDKSTWYWLLSQGYKMGYMPDVSTLSIETQPREGFVDSAVTLMVRWFGNMLRTNGRALGLGPARIGFFTWWSLLDQRISMWTTIAGPISFLLVALFVDPLVLALYLSWVMFTRYLFCTAISLFRTGGFPVTYPVLLYFSQVFGAIVKTYILYRLDKQKWTRQKTTGRKSNRSNFVFLKSSFVSWHMQLLTIGWLAVSVSWMTGLI